MLQVNYNYFFFIRKMLQVNKYQKDIEGMFNLGVNFSFPSHNHPTKIKHTQVPIS